jgi:glutamine cyclotransferase
MASKSTQPKSARAEIVREYGPFPGAAQVHGVTFDGKHVWFASGEHLQAFDPTSGEGRQKLPVTASHGTAFDGRHLFQLANDGIRKIDPDTGEVLKLLPAPAGGNSGLAWAEGSLWVGQYAQRKILRIDPETGRILKTLESSRFVTGVSWSNGELWHATWEDGESEIRRVDPESGEVLEQLSMPDGKNISGLEADGADLFYCGGGPSGKVRAVRRPKRK